MSDDVVPINEFKARASAFVERFATTTEDTVLVTHNGRPAFVAMSPAAYDALVERIEVVTAIGEGLEAAAADEVVTDTQLDAMLDDADRWVTLAEAETVTGVKARTIREWCRTGRIAHRSEQSRCGMQVVVDVDEVKRLRTRRAG